MYLTYLYDVDELYHLNNSTGQVFDKDGNIIRFTDVVVIDLRSYISDKTYANVWKARYVAEGYEITHHIDGVITVLKRAK